MTWQTDYVNTDRPKYCVYLGINSAKERCAYYEVGVYYNAQAAIEFAKNSLGKRAVDAVADLPVGITADEYDAQSDADAVRIVEGVTVEQFTDRVGTTHSWDFDLAPTT